MPAGAFLSPKTLTPRSSLEFSRPPPPEITLKKLWKTLKLKEIRMQPKIGTGDLDFKAKHVQEFLEQGNKVKVTIRFRGRELAHTELGYGVLDEVLKRLECGYGVEKKPSMEGRFMSMILNPKAKK